MPTVGFYQYELDKNTSNWSEVGVVGPANAVVAFDQNALYVLPSYENKAEVRNLVEELTFATVDVIVLDQNNRYFYLGYENGLDVTAVDGGSGTTLTDKNGYTFTFTGQERVPAYEVSASLMGDIVESTQLSL